MSRDFEEIPRALGRALSAPELATFVAELADRPELWIHLVRHDPVQRVYEELFSDAHVTAWLICWSMDQDTGFHDHDVSAGAVAVAGGVYARSDSRSRVSHATGCSPPGRRFISLRRISIVFATSASIPR